MMVGCVDWTRRGQVNEMMCRNESMAVKTSFWQKKQNAKSKTESLSLEILCALLASVAMVSTHNQKIEDTRSMVDMIVLLMSSEK